MMSRMRIGSSSRAIACRLVAIGDSITQGFRSLAISDVDLSVPAMLASSLGLDDRSFRVPDFSGSGGLPFNLEWMADKLENELGSDIRRLEWVRAVFRVVHMLDDVEDYWERGKGSKPIADVLFHNLAVWGFEVGDAYGITPAICREKMGKPKDNWLQPPSEPRLRTAHRVLNPAQLESRDGDTQLEIAKRIKERDGEIGHLIIALGANNALGTIVELDIRPTGNEAPGPSSGFTLWTPEAFREEFDTVKRRVADIGPANVCVATVPHITIPPITRGIMENRGELPEGEKYFDYYTRFWIEDAKFDPDRDPNLTKKQAKTIDDTIDDYNSIIRDCANSEGWGIVDICQLLDDIAYRRNRGNFKRALPPPIADLSTQYFEIHPNGKIKQGGLFGLDGVHPTTAGYGLIAQAYVDAMKQVEPNICDIDFTELRQLDSLVSSPPLVLNDVYGMVRMLERKFHFSRWLAK